MAKAIHLKVNLLSNEWPWPFTMIQIVIQIPGPPILVRILVKFFSPSAQDSWWNRKTLGEMEKLLVKLKSSWWNAWNLGEMESHLVKLNFAKIKTIQEIWFISLINHGSYLVNLAYKLINSKKYTIYNGQYYLK